MDKVLLKDFNYIISFLSPRIQMYLSKLNENSLKNIQEIRLRVNRPVVIVTASGSTFLTNSGKTSHIWSTNCIIAYKHEITDTINKMCDYSMHSHYEDLLNGYITLPNGSRVGICGTAVYDKSTLKGVKEITCINIRIPRNVFGVSETLFNTLFSKKIDSVIICGPPTSGKTTLLKDISYQLSSGRLGKYYKVCIIDERKEICPEKNDMKNIGPNTDVLLGYPKAKGISIATRTLSPDVIVCDEIGADGDVAAVESVANAGVKIIKRVMLTSGINSIDFEVGKEDNMFESSPSTQTPAQTIYYGVPGSGKSHRIDEITKNLSEEQKIRVVFHPEYTNADFDIKTYKNQFSCVPKT